MMAPLYKTGVFGEVGFVIAALVVGVGFGFFLERGGLSNPRKLTAQFYLKDFTVLQAMFTAIVVAMVGLYGLALVGVLDLNLVYLNPTFVWPVIVGATMVGLGFAIGGYCPGTSVVAAVTGRFDALAFIGGMALGIELFADLYPQLSGFTRAGAVAKPATVDGWLGLGAGTVVFLIVLMAVAVFWLIEKLVHRPEEEMSR
jgi:hypothetical protein